MSTPTSLRTNIWFIAFLVSMAFILSFAWLFAIQHSHWGDEIRFVNTISYFGNDFHLQKLVHYNEMSAPLPFVLYAMWGKLVGFALNDLRAFSLIIAVITYVLFFWFIFKTFNCQKLAYFSSMFLMLQPYMLGFSVFVFTDMLPILASIFVFYSARYGKPLLMLLAGLIGLLSRQYFIFLLIAFGLTFFIRFLLKKERNDMYMATAIILSTLPLGVLAYYWQGLSPQTHLNSLYLDEAFRFHPEYLTLYIVQLSIYIFPYIILNVRKIYGNYSVWVISITFSWLYIIFPIEPSPAAQEASFHTVGFLHKMVRSLVGSPGEHLIFYALFTVGIPIAFFILRDLYLRIRLKLYDLIFAMHLSVIFFLIIIPCSYLLWEKYFMPTGSAIELEPVA